MNGDTVPEAAAAAKGIDPRKFKNDVDAARQGRTQHRERQRKHSGVIVCA